MPISIETFFLDPNAQSTLQSQVQQLVAQGILSGRFRAGERLPSSRKLAAHLGVSRITVTLAYTELLADDYITSQGRSGYFVSHNAPPPPPKPIAFEDEASTVDWDGILQGQPPTLSFAKPADWAAYKYPFIYGQADAALFDAANWRLCALRALGKADFKSLTTDYFDAYDPQLIDYISQQTLPRRGILAQPDEILLTLGAQNALWLTAQTLLDQGKLASIENPSYPALRDILSRTGCAIKALNIDAQGLPPDAIPPQSDLVFTTPSHQCPTTTTMPLARRQELLERAERDNFLIVEDDYEFEIPFTGAPSPALKSLDRHGRVIYVGSFSKSLFPGLRLGYLVGPAPFIARARALRAAVLRHPPGHIQRTTAYFLSLGHYDALIRRMGRAYQIRHQIMEKAIKKHGLCIAGQSGNGGSSLWMKATCDSAALAAALRPKGVLIEPGDAFFAQNNPPNTYYRLAYSSISEALIEDGIALIAAVQNQLTTGH